jgi:uncharacterized membrane protein YhaH (DUF805 family)
MPNALSFIAQMLDPRGRCNRMALLYWAGGVLILQVLLIGLFMAVDVDPRHPLVQALNLAFVWMAFSATAKRLHDIGSSAWWALGFFLIWMAGCLVVGLVVFFAIGPDALDPGTMAYMGLLGIFGAPVLYALVWLHAKPGEAGANRFGAEPAGLGLSRPMTAPAGSEAMQSA